MEPQRLFISFATTPEGITLCDIRYGIDEFEARRLIGGRWTRLKCNMDTFEILRLDKTDRYGKPYLESGEYLTAYPRTHGDHLSSVPD